MTAQEIIIRPIITEKSNMALQEGKYTFEVAKKATKIQIATAVENGEPIKDLKNTNNKADTSIKDVVASMKQEEHDMTITEAKNEIRELVEKLKLKGIKISCDEMDFEKATQFMIKIDKE